MLNGHGITRIAIAIALCALPGEGLGQATDVCATCGDATELIARFGLRESATPVRDRAGWAPPRRIVVHGLDEWAQPLRAAAPGIPIITAPTPESAARLLGDADAYFGLCIPEILNQGRNLRWIQLWSAGADPCAGLIAASGRPVMLTNAQALYGPQIAEHATGCRPCGDRSRPRARRSSDGGRPRGSHWRAPRQG
jgi:hypothetical protein